VLFTKRLREGIRRGRIRCSVRVWQTERVKVGGRYAMEDGHIVVDSIESIKFRDVTGARFCSQKSAADISSVTTRTSTSQPPRWYGRIVTLIADYSCLRACSACRCGAGRRGARSFLRRLRVLWCSNRGGHSERYRQSMGCWTLPVVRGRQRRCDDSQVSQMRRIGVAVQNAMRRCRQCGWSLTRGPGRP